jgi:hypothetical protein
MNVEVTVRIDTPDLDVYERTQGDSTDSKNDSN